MSFDYSKPQNLLAQIRSEIGLSTRFVAQEIGLTAQSISFFERTKSPSKSSFLKLKALYETHLDNRIAHFEGQIKKARMLKAGLSLVEIERLKDND